MLDVSGRILLQRAAPPDVLADVFSLLESLMNVGLCVGVVLVPVLVRLSGVRLALLGTAGFFLVLVAVTWIFHSAPDQRIALLKNLAIMGGLLQVMAFGPGEFSLDGRERTK